MKASLRKCMPMFLVCYQLDPRREMCSFTCTFHESQGPEEVLELHPAFVNVLGNHPTKSLSRLCSLAMRQMGPRWPEKLINNKAVKCCHPEVEHSSAESWKPSSMFGVGEMEHSSLAHMAQMGSAERKSPGQPCRGAHTTHQGKLL